MERGEIWTLQDRNYASKARPVVVVQRNLERFDSVVTCLLTSFDSTDIPTRVRVEPDAQNGLNAVSWVMTDKIVTVNKSKLGMRVGRLDKAAMRAVEVGLSDILGLGDRE